MPGQNISTILGRIENKQATVGVVGLGYVGLPLLLCFKEKGFPVVGFDIDETKIESLRNGESYIRHIPTSRIRTAAADKGFTITNDFSL